MGRKVWVVWSTATLQVKLTSSLQKACGYFISQVEDNAEELHKSDEFFEKPRSVRRLMEYLKSEGSLMLYGSEGTLVIESKVVD